MNGAVHELCSNTELSVDLRQPMKGVSKTFTYKVSDWISSSLT